MAKEEILGEYNKIPDTIPAESVVKIEFHPIDLVTHWKRCGLMADFIGSFYSYSSPGKKDERILYNLSTVINELIENAAKFSKQRSPVLLTLKHYSNLLQVQVTNHVTTHVSENFKKLANTLLNSDLEELYFKKLEEKDENDTQSGIGLMMILKDYPVSMAFKFQDHEDGKATSVTVKAFISVEGV
ncbi:MAG: histidine kinase [Leptospiraceae bacterium]|nr:histidine kinase [Leptospiraceae bacterium]